MMLRRIGAEIRCNGNMRPPTCASVMNSRSLYGLRHSFAAQLASQESEPVCAQWATYNGAYTGYPRRLRGRA